MDESIHDVDATDAAMLDVGATLLNELRQRLRVIGFESIAEDSFGLLAVRVVDRDHVGTAYFEFKDGEIRTRIVLVRDIAQELATEQRQEGGGESFEAA